jgi:uncharacterized membrane protein
MAPNLHPLFVHFPIALLLASVAFSWAGRIWHGKGLDQAAWYTLLLGLAGALFSVFNRQGSLHSVLLLLTQASIQGSASTLS